MKNPTWLLSFSRDVYSQTGEDGIIEKILSILPKKDNWCVEVGAWDGLFNSNTRNLIENFGYYAVLIEGNRAKYAELKINCLQNKNVIAINAFVGFKENGLDTVLEDTPIPIDFDFLSIDIDGNDFHLWKAMSKYKPKAVCIEFNPTIPTEVDFVQPANLAINQGASLSALVALARTKGYELVSVLPFNAFFVKANLYSLFGITDNAPEVLRTCSKYITYFFSGYDGKIFLYGNKELPWHYLRLKESKFQLLPSFLRKFPSNYNNIEKCVYGGYLFLSNPRRFFRMLVKKIWGQ